MGEPEVGFGSQNCSIVGMWVTAVKGILSPIGNLGPKSDLRLTHLELELEAYIWWFRSTHGYYKITKYQLSSSTLTLRTRNRIFQDFALLTKSSLPNRTFKSAFSIFSPPRQLPGALPTLLLGVRQQTWYVGAPTSSVLSIFQVFTTPRFFWKIFFRPRKFLGWFSKKGLPPGT